MNLASCYCPIVEALLAPLQTKCLEIIPHDTCSIAAFDVNGVLLLIAFCHLSDNWVAYEEVDEDEPLESPRWYAEDDIAVSPIYQLKACAAHVKEETGTEAFCALSIPSTMKVCNITDIIPSWPPVKAITFENYDTNEVIKSKAYFNSLKEELIPARLPLDEIAIKTALATFEYPS